MTRVIFVGGPRDGEWWDISQAAQFLRIGKQRRSGKYLAGKPVNYAYAYECGKLVGTVEGNPDHPVYNYKYCGEVETV